MNKKCIFCTFAAVLAMAVTVDAQQYQPLNAGFENWDGSTVDAEPTSWNSFASGDGSMASLASSPHHYHRSGHRTGGTGSSYLVLYTKSIMGIKANGNMTTGRIHMGAASATSESNYNYTARSASGFNQPFTATPDSLYVWVSYYASDASSKASVSAFIHGNSDFRDPNDINTASLYAGKAVLQFARTTNSATSPVWSLKKVPFSYSGTATPAYLLMSLTTNMNPGGGSAGDSLMIDDIQFVYSAWLNSITMNGSTLPDFERGHLEYTVYVDDEAEAATLQFAAVPQASDATVTVDTLDGSTVNTPNVVVVYRFNVTAEDGTAKVYNVLVKKRSGSEGIATVRSEIPSLTAYPNPAADMIQVEPRGHGEGTVMVQIINAQGATVATYEVPQGGAAIPVGKLTAGVYILKTPLAATRIVRL